MDLRPLAEALAVVRAAGEKADAAWQARQQAWADLAAYLHPDRDIAVGAKDLDFNTRFTARELILCDHLHQIRPDLMQAPSFEGEMSKVIKMLHAAEQSNAEAEAAQQEYRRAQEALARSLGHDAPDTDDELIAAERVVDGILARENHS